MTLKSNNPTGRKKPTHLFDVGPPGRHKVFFVTVCTKNKRPLLANPSTHQLLLNAWDNASAWMVGRYVVMSDHIHLFCCPATDEVSLQSWIRFWKSCITKSWPDPTQLPLWLQNYWDRQLRRAETYDSKWQYVCQNPVRHKLVENAQDWPYQGELNILRW